MDVTKAKQICKEFRPIKTDSGKMKCRFIQAGLCKRPEYFRCELLLWKEKDERSALALPSTSVSRISTGERCPRLYALNYVYKVDPPLKPMWKVVGSAFSDCRAKIDAGLPWELSGEIKSYPLDVAKLRSVLRHYEKKRDKGLKGMSEVRVSVTYKDINLTGFIDFLTLDRKTIYEWKYAATQYDELLGIRQAAVYLKGVPEATKFILAVAKKPMHKPKKAGKPTKKNPEPKAETMFEFEKRAQKVGRMHEGDALARDVSLWFAVAEKTHPARA